MKKFAAFFTKVLYLLIIAFPSRYPFTAELIFVPSSIILGAYSQSTTGMLQFTLIILAIWSILLGMLGGLILFGEAISL